MKRKPKTKQKSDARAAARIESENLLEMAKAMWVNDQGLSLRYVKLARRIAMRHRVHLDPRTYCKACGVPFTADTLQVRQERANKTVLYACRHCRTTRRIPYKGKTKPASQEAKNRQPGSTGPSEKRV